MKKKFAIANVYNVAFADNIISIYQPVVRGEPLASPFKQKLVE